MSGTTRLGRRTGIARYHQLYTVLVRALADGSISAGSALPSEAELMRCYDVSRNTVRHALARLEKEKRIIRRRGSGTFAREFGGGKLLAAQVVSATEDLWSMDSVCTSRILQFGKSRTPVIVRQRWPSFSLECVLVRRVWAFQEQLFAVVTSYVELTAGGKLTRGAIGNRPLTAALEDIGTQSGAATQICRAEAADAIVADQLGVLPGSPLLALMRWIHDIEGRPLQYQQLLYRNDLYELQLSLELDRGADTCRWQVASA
jgi:GntR family transcriptional regulator